MPCVIFFVGADIQSESSQFMSPNEARTRKQLIDGQIAKAGWDLFDHSKVRFEVPANGDDDDWFDGITDYSLYMQNTPRYRFAVQPFAL